MGHDIIPDINDVAKDIRRLMTNIDADLDLSLSGQRGAKAAAKRVRRNSKGLEHKMLQYRKLSLREIG